MTYKVVVAAKNANVTVRVDANDPRTAQEIAHWVVSHHAHLQMHGTGTKPIKT